jgi:putative spermidine/putrescine transport system substrate-binding protein
MKLQGITSLFAAGAIVAAASAVAPAPADAAGRFEGQQVRVATFGGSWRDLIMSTVGEMLKAEGGELVIVAGQPADTMAKLIAARGAEPPFDLMETTDDFLPALESKGYLDEIPLGGIANAGKLVDADKSKLWVKTWTTQEGIIYNTEKFKENGIPAPKKYADLANPKLAGRVSIPDISGGGAVPCLVGMAVEMGGDEANIDPALDFVQKLDIKAFWRSNSNLQQLFTSGDVWAACGAVHTIARLQGKVPLWSTMVEVKPGTFGVLKQGWLARVKGGKNAAAQEFVINAFLSDEHQRGILKGGLLPASKSILAELATDPDKGYMRRTPEEIATMYQVDYAKVERTDYNREWSKRVGKSN